MALDPAGRGPVADRESIASQAADGRLAEPRPSDPTRPTLTDPDVPRPDDQALPPAALPPGDAPATADGTQPDGTQPEAAQAGDDGAAEPKKKPARRGAKRASVPSWDEIMFGKKAD